jgi:hypothetical protein
MRRRLFRFAAIATGLAAVDLVHELIQPTRADAFHPRSTAYFAAATALLAALAAVGPLLPTRAALAGAGVAAGGVLGNLVSALAWHSAVPNPLVLGSIATNLADLCVLGGDAALVGAVAIHVLRNRHRLREPLRA